MEILNGTFIQISSEDAEILMEIYDSVFKIGEISKSKDLERCLLFARNGKQKTEAIYDGVQ